MTFISTHLCDLATLTYDLPEVCVYVHIHVSQEGHSHCDLAVVVNTISQLDIQILYTVVYKHLNSRTFVFKCRVYVDACRWTFS